MTDLFVAGLVLLALVTAYIAGRLHQALIDVERSNHLPYKVRAGMDDLSAVSTDALLQVRDETITTASWARSARGGMTRSNLQPPE